MMDNLTGRSGKRTPAARRGWLHTKPAIHNFNSREAAGHGFLMRRIMIGHEDLVCYFAKPRNHCHMPVRKKSPVEVAAVFKELGHPDSGE